MQHQQSEEDGMPAPPMIKPTLWEVQACQFSSWYYTFRNMNLPDNTSKHRKNVTIESAIISPLPSDFIKYLLSDGVRLPSCATKVSSCMNDADSAGDKWDSEADDGSSEEEEGFSFPSLTEEIQSAIDRLGGGGKTGCMPKLNWSAPKDATWINCGSLKCTKAGDVYLLLKSSEFVAFDLERSRDEVTADVSSDMNNLALDSNANEQTFELVLRKWCNLHPSMEFRCFVYDHEIIAISQRHPSKYYSHLQQPTDDDEHPLLAIIDKFFSRYVRKRFADGKMNRYVLDLYIDSQERTWIIDFNVWSSRTDGLLFDWEELTNLGLGVGNTHNQTPVKPDFRVVTGDMKSMTYDPLSSFRGPTDVMDLLGQGNSDSDGFDSSSFENFMKQCVPPSEM